MPESAVVAKPPRGAQAAGKRLWAAVLGKYELEEHELALLVQAVHVADLCDQLQAVVDRDGSLAGRRVHPATVELRAERITLARLVVAMRVPIGDQTEAPSKTGAPRLQRRGARGVYQIGHAS